MEVINSQIRAFLETHLELDDPTITDFINKMVPDVTPTVKLHQIDLEKQEEPLLVYAHMAVQDIRDSDFYYSFIMKRPFKADQKFTVLRWGCENNELPEDALENPEYIKVMLERDHVICTSIPGLTHWAEKMEGKTKQFTLFVDGKSDFKLGEVINIVAYYYPGHQNLYFVRKATQEQIEKEVLNPVQSLGKGQINFELTRQEILSFFSSYCSETFAEYLLLCLTSEEPLFLGAEADISPLITTVYPRVKHLKLVHPCEDSLFPFKNEDGEMMAAPLQLSVLPTFVSIDLSAYSSKNVVEIGEKTINNFKALKVFVEESKTIYRWEYGESLFDHRHKGIIVKASSFLNPHFHPKEQSITPDFSTLDKIPDEHLMKFRHYIAAIQSLNPLLPQEEREKIEQVLKAETQKKKLGEQLSKIMQLSKLLAKTYGRKEIKIDDFQRARILINSQVVNTTVQ